MVFADVASNIILETTVLYVLLETIFSNQLMVPGDVSVRGASRYTSERFIDEIQKDLNL